MVSFNKEGSVDFKKLHTLQHRSPALLKKFPLLYCLLHCSILSIKEASYAVYFKNMILLCAFKDYSSRYTAQLYCFDIFNLRRCKLYDSIFSRPSL